MKKINSYLRVKKEGPGALASIVCYQIDDSTAVFKDGSKWKALDLKTGLTASPVRSTRAEVVKWVTQNYSMIEKARTTLSYPIAVKNYERDVKEGNISKE